MEKKDELLLLVAVSGELPADWIGRAVGSEAYAAALLTRLKREGELKLRNGNGIRGYLLRAKAKQYLLEAYPEEVESCFLGSASTNHVKSEPEKRLRLHRMSMVWIFCHRAGIRIFHSEKPELFHDVPTLLPGTLSVNENRTAAYYGTAEWKRKEDKEIKGSRACGVLAADRFYIVYNTMDSLMKWTPKTERNLRSRMEMRLRRSRGGVFGGAIFFGTGMELLGRLLTSHGGIKGTLFALDDVYEALYFVPFQREAVLQLRLLCDQGGQKKLNQFLCSALKEVKEELFGLEAGTDEDGNPVYFCYLLELWQLRRISQFPFRRSGRIFCFTYQAPALEAVFGASCKVEAIRPDKVYRYLGWEE